MYAAVIPEARKAIPAPLQASNAKESVRQSRQPPRGNRELLAGS
jgi:hypothetical protein